MTTMLQTQTTKEAIDALLDTLPPESLTVVRQFVEFLRQQAQQGQPVVTAVAEVHPPYLYPTVATPISNLQSLGHGLNVGYEGDALADTEALYDEDY